MVNILLLISKESHRDEEMSNMHFSKTTTRCISPHQQRLGAVIILHLRSASEVFHHLASRQQSFMTRPTTLTVGTQSSLYMCLLLNESSEAPGCCHSYASSLQETDLIVYDFTDASLLRS